MVGNIIGLIILVALAVGFVWLARRAWRSRSALVRWGGTFLSGLVALLLAVVAFVAAIGLYKLNVAPYRYTASDIKINATQEDIARGQRLAAGCADCHSTAGIVPLDGSKDNFVAGGPPMGILYAPNLTPGGPLKDWTDGEIIRAIREGVDKNGRPLVIMPAPVFHYLSDADVQQIVAFLRSQPAVNRDVPERNLNLLAALFIGSGMFSTSAQPPITQAIIAPPKGTADYGAYLVNATGCKDCHGVNLTGGTPGGFGPVGPNIAALVPNWNEQGFVQTFRNGVDPTGHQLSDEMPWKSYSKMFTDDELKDLYSYLHGLNTAAGQ
jgi:mono/diheme cytochrome c family protein